MTVSPPFINTALLCQLSALYSTVGDSSETLVYLDLLQFVWSHFCWDNVLRWTALEVLSWNGRFLNCWKKNNFTLKKREEISRVSMKNGCTCRLIIKRSSVKREIGYLLESVYLIDPQPWLVTSNCWRLEMRRRESRSWRAFLNCKTDRW